MDGKKSWHAPGAGTKDGDSFLQQKIDCTVTKDDDRSEFFQCFCFYFHEALINNKAMR